MLDRLIQQALLQVLQPIFDPTFSDASFGFRPGRSAHDAVRRACSHIAAGHRWVVDLDLEKFFDRVNHDVLMARVARRVKDPRVLGLIRRYLQAGMMAGGLMSPRTEGTPQGGPLSPLLSNILLDDLDRELERRGTASPGMPTTATYTCNRGRPASGCWHRWNASWRNVSGSKSIEKRVLSPDRGSANFWDTP